MQSHGRIYKMLKCNVNIEKCMRYPTNINRSKENAFQSDFTEIISVIINHTKSFKHTVIAVFRPKKYNCYYFCFFLLW